MSTVSVLREVRAERAQQDEKFPNQDIPDGTGDVISMQDPSGVAWSRAWVRDRERDATDAAAKRGDLTWRHVLSEEFHEAVAERDVEALRKELIQVAAVAVRWIEHIDGRSA